MQDLVKSFNEDLVVTYNSRYSIIDYIRKINNMYTKPIDISFMGRLLKYVDQDTY